jgi:hypothetical protein
VRLGNLASSLARLADFTRLQDAAGVDRLTRECISFLEWVGPDAEPAIQPNLVQIQRELARWSRRWDTEPRDEALREELRRFAREQSDRVLEWSGLLDG